MNDKIKNIIVSAVFSIFMLAFCVLCVFHSPNTTSESERRKLAQFPQITVYGLLNGDVMDDFESYTLDQFPGRDAFRALKTAVQRNVFFRQENNNLAIVGDTVIEINSKLSEDSVNNAINKLNSIYEKYLRGTDTHCFLSVVPDKNYFAAEDYGYPSINYKRLTDMIRSGLSQMQYIDIFDTLEISDYYFTDTHWRQERLENTVAAISETLGCAGDGVSFDSYRINELAPFYGVYAGQSAMKLEPDTICYLTDEILDECTVYDYETGKTNAVYELGKFKGSDSYEIFLSGTKALLKIDNPNAKNDRELIIFRDSFGSSLAPLLAQFYESVILVDIRYIDPSLLESYVTFEAQDILFIYSTLILNNSFSFK